MFWLLGGYPSLSRIVDVQIDDGEYAGTSWRSSFSNIDSKEMYKLTMVNTLVSDV